MRENQAINKAESLDETCSYNQGVIFPLLEVDEVADVNRAGTQKL